MNYVRLYDASLRISSDVKTQALMDAEVWPGPPENPILPNHIKINTDEYLRRLHPTRQFQGRNFNRGGGYASLSNYNTIP